jgi:deoxyguanosine kinase
MYLAIEGVIGVGKTTLVRLLQPIFDAASLLEVFEENPFLSDFYADRQRYAFQTQIFFLLSRYRHQRQLVPELRSRGHLIADYTFAKDSLFASLNLQGDELATYQLLHEALAERIHAPDLVVYLRASTPVILRRISKRDRAYERDMDEGYIQDLNRAYEAFFSRTLEFPVLAVDSDELDFVGRPQDLAAITDQIRGALGLPPFQPELPLHGGRPG